MIMARVFPSVAAVLKSDQNGIEIESYNYAYLIHTWLKSDQNGIEMTQLEEYYSDGRVLKSDQNGIEIKTRCGYTEVR